MHSAVFEVSSRLKANCAKGFRWWAAALAALLPSKLKLWFAADYGRTVVDLRARKEVTIYDEYRSARATSSTAPRFTGTLEEARRWIEQHHPERWRPLVLRVSRNDCLVRELTVPCAALEHVPEVLRLDLESTTPFKRSEVFCGEVIGASFDGAAIVTHYVVKRAACAPLLDAEASAIISHIEVGDAAACGRVELFPQGQQTPALSGIGRLVRTIGRASVALAIASGIVFASAIIGRDADQLAALSAEATALRKSAAAAKDKLAALARAGIEASALRRRKIEAASAVSTIETLSRLLPDDSHLSELQLEDGAAVIDGWAASAADLIGRLTSAQVFAQVELVAPVTRDATKNAERFRLRLTSPRTGK